MEEYDVFPSNDVWYTITIICDLDKKEDRFYWRAFCGKYSNEMVYIMKSEKKCQPVS